MNPAPPPPWPRRALAALAVLAGFWLLSQLTVATWLAREADVRAAGWAQGDSPWRWDFRVAGSVVRSGSHGLEASQPQPQGLNIRLPTDGVVALSLALGDERVDAAAVEWAEIELAGEAPLRLQLMTGADGAFLPWTTADLGAGEHPGIRLPLDSTVQRGAEGPILDRLLLRIESTPGARLELRRLALRAPPCTAEDCGAHRRSAPSMATPEQLLGYRDAQRAQAPAVAVEASGWIGAIGRGLARALALMPNAIWRLAPIAAALLLLFAAFCRLRARPDRYSARFRPRLELALTLALALTLLLAGWPARDTPASLGFALVGSLAALAIFPLREPPRWRWIGDRAAWRAALGFTALAALLIAPLGLLDDTAASARDASRFLRYPLWALVQQWLLLTAIAPRLLPACADARLAALGCGAVFGLMHAPNFALMLVTCIGGSVWAWLGWRHRALLPLALSHAALGLWLTQVAPSWLLRSAEIGGRYLMVP